MDDWTIRAARADDADAIAPLLAELGHPLPAAAIAARIGELAATQPGAANLVAERGGRVLGLATAQSLLVLHRAEPVGRVTALVVRADLIGTGIGTRLLAAAEAFLAARGCRRIEVTSAAHRHDAHAFYLKRGFARQGERFAKELG